MLTHEQSFCQYRNDILLAFPSKDGIQFLICFFCQLSFGKSAASCFPRELIVNNLPDTLTMTPRSKQGTDLKYGG